MDTASFYLWGLIGEKTVDLDALCPQGVSRWENRADVMDVVLSCVTIGIYSQRTIEVHCAGGAAYLGVEHPDLGVTEFTPLPTLNPVTPYTRDMEVASAAN